MIKLNELQVSRHFQYERRDRKDRIDSILRGNFGQVTIEEWYKDAWRCLTDTGLCAIVSYDKTRILTYYFCPLETARMMYKSQGRKLPEAIGNKIKKNARTYRDLYDEVIQ